MIASDATAEARQGSSVSLSGDGLTAIIGAPTDSRPGIGAAWVWVKNGSAWTQQGNKLPSSGAVEWSNRGSSVSLSSDGNTALVSGANDSRGIGATWVSTRSGTAWTQLGAKLVGTGAAAGTAYQGVSVLSADGTTAIVGGNAADNSAGAAWIFARPALPNTPAMLTSAWVDGKVSLSWVDASSDETGFEVERRVDPSGTYAQIAAPARNVNFSTDVSAVGTTSYCYRVRATKGTADSAYSNESCVAGYGTATAGQKLQFSSASYSIPGTPADAAVTITRTGGSSGTITVTLLVSGGTASSGDDYLVLPNSAISFVPGETTKTVAAIRVLANNPPNNLTVRLRLTKPSGEVVLGTPSSATLTIASAPAVPPGNVGIFDTACIATASRTDCTGESLRPAGYPAGDNASLERLNVRRIGAVTDGVTLLLLRVRSSTPVTFALKLSSADAPAAYGTLLWRDGTHQGQSVTINPEASPAGPTAYALYLAPAQLPAAAGNLQVVATNGAGASPPAPIALKLPPVVLMHGVWSGPSAFASPEHLSESLFGYLVNEQIYAVTATYEDDPAGSFDPSRYSTPILALSEATDAALRKARAHDVAASQVDVVAHSMGGLVARARATGMLPQGFTLMKELVKYARPENRYKGEFHKLITIGTPHRGTTAATWFAEHRCDYFGSLEALFQRIHKPFGDAVYQFQPSHPVLRTLGEARVPTHTIAGRTPGAWTASEAILNAVLSAFPFTTMDTILGGGRDHDVLVPLASQLAGRNSGNSWTLAERTIHSDNTKIGVDRAFAETTNPELFPRIGTLLRGPIEGYFEVIQQPSIAGNPLDNVPCAGSARAPNQLAAGSVTLTPSAGTIVRPGEEIQVTLSVPDDGASTQAIISIEEGMTLVDGVAGVFGLAYTIPSHAAGDVTISATTLRGDGDNYDGSTYVTVLPAVPPDTLTVSPNAVTMSVPHATAQITVTGGYANGSTITLTSGAAGTTYATESGTTAVVGVSASGLISANGNGEETIVVRHGRLVTSVSVIVAIVNGRPALNAIADTTIHPGQAVDIALTASRS